MNQRYGFALGYDDYHNYEVQLLTSPQAILCNKPPFHSIAQDLYGCLEAQVITASQNGINDYQAYIEGEKTNFRQSYVNTCSAAQATASLRTQSQVYHYTLYYYDQADNLVRTVPPEGVHPLTGPALVQVSYNRNTATTGTCGYNSRAKINDRATMLDQLSSILGSTGPVAIEMWLYNPTSGISQFTEVSSDQKWLFSVAIQGTTVALDIYPITISTNPVMATFNAGSKHYRATIQPSVLPLSSWTHVIIQGANGLAYGTSPQIFINGMWTVIQASNTPMASWSLTATSSGIQLPDIYPTLKHIRFYHQVFSQPVLTIMATNNCFAPRIDSDLNNIWVRFNLPSPGGPTTTGPGSVEEIRTADVYPNHTLPTSYIYNSTNQVTKQWSPDGGTNRFWYDLLSRLTVSQNDKQNPAKKYSYTLYDTLGRITEVGEKRTDSTLAVTTINNNPIPDYVASPANFLASGSNRQITKTYYDTPAPATGGIASLPEQDNLRKRVSASTYTEAQGSPVQSATYYNYDLDGNVKTLWQQISGLGLKRVDYEYDLVSGKVNFVGYQQNKADQFYYWYQYDADNRLTDAWSGTQAILNRYTGSQLLYDNKKQDAHYEYYLHGPLARLELGDQYGKVQGIDYAYTLQGWLKGVNGQQLNPQTEMSADGYTGHSDNGTIARDAYGYALGYYRGDYRPIGGTAYTAFNLPYQNQTGDITGQNLYNGNISNSTLAISALNSGAAVGYTYHYDQLNRLKNTRQHNGISGTSWNRNSITANYAEDLSYDANGNIQTVNRNGNAGNMDNLLYLYNKDVNGYLSNNQLTRVYDAASDGAYTDDLKNQTDNYNYRYDAIGNLIHDTQAGIDSIKWTVYGKIQSIYKSTNNISYTYNPGGQRISKTGGNKTTWYVRDAQGNTLALYDSLTTTGSSTMWREQHLYGSSRLGLWTPNINANQGSSIAVWDTLGRKFYELNNHLGNVLATLTDRRVQQDNGNVASPDYLADVATAQDYYPFGSLMPGRQYTANGLNYRYGFNGKENDNEVKGQGNQQDYGMRIYDPRVGRFLSVDPLREAYPWYTPYQYAGNQPIWSIDLDGAEEKKATDWEAFTYPKFKKLATANDVWKQTQNKFPRSTPQVQYLQFKYRLGRIFEAAVLASLDREKNTKRYYPDPLDRSSSVIPDAVTESATQEVRRNSRGEDAHITFVWKEGAFIDAKTSESNIIDNSEQLKGFVNILANQNNVALQIDDSFLERFFGVGKEINKSAAKSKAAFLHIITPANTKIDPQLVKFAEQKGVRVFQSETEIKDDMIRISSTKELTTNKKPIQTESIQRQGYGNETKLNFSIQ
ncbi:RHS repeat domain-containing protein [Mucilaginibacter paludis]|uniref:RHS repeat-associated core domain-containing protein n=1 Tax=Mucilaginibacter paludis DSM 18603 TaxID=714943 RepID=H1YDZ1_9SPHI|nr:RHS repeat-associated core domain-containing protein [Mucilaginibacter paludis]EHQ24331.1 RHS repeat-associated core domain-containing protein [Mucilaginibacter paludis DSM 18603]